MCESIGLCSWVSVYKLRAQQPRQLKYAYASIVTNFIYIYEYVQATQAYTILLQNRLLVYPPTHFYDYRTFNFIVNAAKLIAIKIC